MKPFLEVLQQRPLLGDGAMGTLLYARGVPIEQNLEALVVEQPGLIATIHEEYLRAGADLLTTHTFGANRMRLAYHGWQDNVRDFNLRAVALAQGARQRVGSACFIAGNVGPVGKRVAWDNPQARAAVANTFREQITVLAEAGVDLLLFETFSDVAELEVAVEIAKQTSALPIVASMSYGEDGLTLARQDVAMVTRRLVAAGVDVIGANCSVGPGQMVATLHVMRASAPNAILSVAPNAGLPVTDEDGTLRYPVDAAEFANYAGQFWAKGTRLVGGCCGTTPKYIAAMLAVI